MRRWTLFAGWVAAILGLAGPAGAHIDWHNGAAYPAQHTRPTYRAGDCIKSIGHTASPTPDSMRLRARWRRSAPRDTPSARDRLPARDSIVHGPMAHGVVFFCPEQPEAAVTELRKIRADGFRLIEFASWCWTLPAPGSQLERTASAVLDWCDGNGVRFVLMHNIQFGSQGEGGGLDDAVTDPLRAERFLTDWLRVLRGHSSVHAVILGNEVGPVAGSQKTPRWWAAFTEAMRAAHGTIERLNAAWGTTFTSFEALQLPLAGSPGSVDLDAFATRVFGHFYGTLFDRVIRPALDPNGRRGLLVGCKCDGNPLIQRACESFSMICWDDVLSDYPQWRLKALGDVARATGKPVFNAELHLYHDSYAYAPSAAKSRYRYFLSAINNEWLTASFAWGQWTKPGAASVHAVTPGILADLDRLEPVMRRFTAEARPILHVLLCRNAAANDEEMQRLYSRMAGLGLQWEYVCPQDLPHLRSGTLFVPDRTGLSAPELQALLALPGGLAIVLAAPE